MFNQSACGVSGRGHVILIPKNKGAVPRNAPVHGALRETLLAPDYVVKTKGTPPACAAVPMSGLCLRLCIMCLCVFQCACVQT
jgi:hypothetical protein